MSQIVKTTIFLTAILVGASYANAAGERLKISKSITTTDDIKAMSNSAEAESSEVANSMQHLFNENEEAETKEVLEYVETEMGHQESSTASMKASEEEKTN